LNLPWSALELSVLFKRSFFKALLFRIQIFSLFCLAKPSFMVKKDKPLPHSRLLKLFQVIAVLKAGRWTIKQLVERFDTSKSSLYRYLELLEEAGFYIEKDFHDRYFIVTTDDDPMQSQFTIEETQMMRSLIQADADHPLKSAVLKKLSMHSEIDSMPRLFLKAHLGNLVEQLNHAMRNRHQVTLKHYHSANSNEIRDRQIEPIHFGDNYGTIVGLDLEDLQCKQYKLDRIGEIVESHKTFMHESLHQQRTADIFGLAGDSSLWITLYLSLRAYLLLREEFPLALPYMKSENSQYIFHGPVSNFSGIGRFVMGLFDEIEVVGPEEFKEYVHRKLINDKTTC
jgi:proteasome accessory factor C